MIFLLIASSLAFAKITPLTKEDKLSIKNISCAKQWYHYFEEQEKVPLVTKTFNGDVHHIRYLWNSKLYLDPPDKLHNGLEIVLSPGEKDKTSLRMWHHSDDIRYNGKPILDFRNTSLYFYGVWEPNRVRKYNYGSEGENAPTDLDYRADDSKLCIIDQKRIGPDLFVRLPFNFEGKPIWRKLWGIEKNKMEFDNLLGDAFTFHNMPPFIESADGKKVFLIDHSLKDKFKGKEVKLLEKSRDAEYWEQHYVTRIENGYVYFNTYVPVGWIDVLNEKIDSFMDKIPNAERRVSVEYFFRDNGSVAVYIFKSDFSDPANPHLRSKLFAKANANYEELFKRFQTDTNFNVRKSKYIDDQWKKTFRAVID